MTKMKVSFDGIRKGLARNYNALAESVGKLDFDDPSWKQEADLQEIMDNVNDLRDIVVTFLCIYNDDVEDDLNMIVDEVKLRHGV